MPAATTTDGTGLGQVSEPMFSVVVPTRNRPDLFRAALASVMGQEETSVEVVVVNDGSADAHGAAYREIEWEMARAGRAARFVHLPQTVGGHGSSHALNTGSWYARGRFVCFLDDDDVWTDTGHLVRVRALAEAASDAELLLFDQDAFRGGERVLQPIWLEDLGVRLRESRDGDVATDMGSAYRVTAAQLLTATGFCHLNTTVIATDLFRRIGGLDETIRWENDHGFYLRAIECARAVLYCPVTVARHNVPDPALRASITTGLPAVERRMDQFRVMHRVARVTHHPGIRKHARRHRRYALQKAWAAGTWRDRWRVALAVLQAMRG